ncbi:hypothetical protein F5884DRAFT_805025 [Xylogone sp. PMI_703]|nr:hypothetical protein F5884DRAFT_805025 [Xylogone sp. PMI_703]
MDRPRSSRPSPNRGSGHDSTMYDDYPRYRDESPQRHSREDQAWTRDNSHSSRRYEDDRYYRSGRDRYESDQYNRDHDRGSERSRYSHRGGSDRYIDRDREDYESPSGHRSRSPARSQSYKGQPSRTVILEGLPVHFTQEDILNELKDSLHVDGIEEIRLIKDKKTGLSRQFAFAQFSTIGEATRFLDRFHPKVGLYGPSHSDQDSSRAPAYVRITFSREREEREPAGRNEDDWMCDVCNFANYPHRTLCFRCNAPRTVAAQQGLVAPARMSAFSGLATTGDTDVSPDNTASQFLLLRGLEPSVTEEILAKGVSKLYKNKESTASSDVHTAKKPKISSTSRDVALGAPEGTLRRVLLVRDRKTNDSWRYGFAEFNTVDDAKAAMAKYNAAEKFTISSKPVMVSYIHAGVFVPMLYPTGPESSRFTFSPLLNPSLKLMYWDEAAYASELIVSEQTDPTTFKEVEQTNAAAKGANEGIVEGKKPDDAKSKKRKAEKEATVVAPHLQFWNNRHAELHGLPAKDPSATAEDSGSANEEEAKEAEKAPPKQSFADMERKCCLLCSRQFKSEAEVNKHERLSQLHRDNLKNEDLVAKATAKLKKSAAAGTDASAYRDRAKERRQAFNQPKQPASQKKVPKDSPGPSANDEELAAPVQSKGAALLGKMGWTAGEGLGAQGTGRTESIETHVYAQGVGLGAEGGRLGDAVEEAQRQTKSSYADFLNKTKDLAKERYQRMG